MNKVSFSVHSIRPRFTGSEWVDSHSIHSSLDTNDAISNTIPQKIAQPRNI
jgi:hypothetical protein